MVRRPAKPSCEADKCVAAVRRRAMESRLLDAARRDLAAAKRARDPLEALLLRRAAAEKAWGYVEESITRATGVVAVGVNADEVRRLLEDHLGRTPGVRMKSSRTLLRWDLHEHIFESGDCPLRAVEEGLARAEEYARSLRRAVGRVRRRGRSRAA